MSIINVDNLRMEYRVRHKKEGLIGSFKGLVSRSYRVVEAVKDISFSIEKGEFVGLIGPNGAGKTTILKVLSGILHPKAGNARVMGYTPWERRNDFRRRLSIVMGQRSQLWWDLPAIETFYINKEIYGVPEGVFRERFDHLTDLMDVKSQLSTQVRQLSLGQRMKMELIAALLHQPEIVYLDEPTIGLDVVSQRNIREFLRAINSEDGVTVILTSHYMADISELCERLLIIDQGSLIYDGQFRDVFKEYGQMRTIQFSLDGKKICEKDLCGLGELVSFEDNQARFKVKAGDTQKMCEKVLGRFKVNDIDIQKTSIEDIMYDLFDEGSAGDISRP